MNDFVVELIAGAGYWGIAFLMALENIVPPIPSELIMGLGGIAVARGSMAIVPLIAVGTAGTVVGNYFWYWVGRRVGYERLKPFIERWGRWLTVDWQDVEKVQGYFVTHGGWVVFTCRFLPNFRTMISLPAGLSRMPLWRFVLWTAAGSTVWNTFLAAAGYFLGRNFTNIDHYLVPATIGMAAVVALVYLYRVITWKPKD